MPVLRQAAKAAFATCDRFLKSPPGPRILIYHQVGAGLGRQMEVKVSDFEWQLDWLVKNREVVTLDEALLRWFEPFAEQLAVLTFDDGYRDTITTAFPLLAERGLPFTLYLATEMIESSEKEALNWDEIEEMLSSGFLTVGSHTHSHRDLRFMSVNQIVDELSTADALVQQRLGFSPTHFAYPWGYWSSTAHDVVANRYLSATLGSSAGREGATPHQIHRFPVQLSDGKRWFRPRLRGGLIAEEWIRRRIRGYRGP